MRRHCYLFIFCLVGQMLSSRTVAQVFSPSSYLTDMHGNILRPSPVTDGVQGSKYLMDDWTRGILISGQDKRFDLPKVRFNILQNRLEYEQAGNVYEPAVWCKEFILSEPQGDGTFGLRTFRTNFPAVDQQTEDTFYEILYDGNIKLVRYYLIRVNEYAEPLTTTRIKRFTKVSGLYLYHSQKRTMTKFSKNKEELLELMADKKQQVEQFMTDQKIRKVTSEEAVIKVCKFYDGAE